VASGKPGGGVLGEEADLLGGEVPGVGEDLGGRGVLKGRGVSMLGIGLGLRIVELLNLSMF
jgi:hypothetical protein